MSLSVIEDEVDTVHFLYKKKWKGEGNIESKKPIERTIKMNQKWLRLLSVVFLSAMMLMGCNTTNKDNNPAPPNKEEPVEDPKDATDPDNIDDNDGGTNTEDPIEDPKDATDPDNIDDNDGGTNTEDPIEDPKDATDPDNKDE
ncbi:MULTISPECIES: hypothetical protein [unclassified Peribacillus]|uniref:hypothetical protein n=1 Tax=unclassified Peribacillus TaxID=2675266 RepID=UPI001F5BCC41|nr:MULTISPECIES: hypothetical protein [unclassified Peribacillus]WMX57737.1 hypothetical protein RE409_11300 [Peribacillus sp. R9-11]